MFKKVGVFFEKQLKPVGVEGVEEPEEDKGKL